MNSDYLITALRRFADRRGTAEGADPHLLERYIVRREEAAFAALVRQHGGMVWGVCRRVLADANDADDAFQAIFLVLVHKAASLRGRDSLAGFLQGVAWRLARRVKAEATRRQAKERRTAPEQSAAVEDVMRSKSYLGAYLRRQRSRLRAAKAITAMAYKLARIVYNLMRYGLAYVKQTEAAYAEQVRDRLEKQLHRRARELGFELKKLEPVALPLVE